MNKKYLVSGIGPSAGGVGRLVERLAPVARNFGYVTVFRPAAPISELVKGKEYVRSATSLFIRLIGFVVFQWRIVQIKNDLVLALHPQTIGYRSTIRLLKRNKFFLYLMDSSFFCMTSYNYREDHGECLRCLGNPDRVLKDCVPWPGLETRHGATKFLHELRKNSSNLIFLAQTEFQKQLVFEHFGKSADCRVVGMVPSDLKFNFSNSTVKPSQQFDLVFHGSAQLAKGFSFFIQLAISLPHLKIFMPVSIDVANSVLGYRPDLKHVVFQKCDWESGLREVVMGAKLVVNPSLWSAPIEGALLKSLAFNGNVAVVETKFGFSNDETLRKVLIHLPNDVEKAAAVVNSYFEDKLDRSEQAKYWLKNFYNVGQTEELFRIINNSVRFLECTH